MADLFETLKDARGCKTRKGAENRLKAFKYAIPDEVTSFVAERPDGVWLAVVIHSNRANINIPFLCHNGICVTN